MSDADLRELERLAVGGDEESGARLLQEHRRRQTFVGRSLGRLAGLGDSSARALLPGARNLDPQVFAILLELVADSKEQIVQRPGGMPASMDMAQRLWEAHWALDAWLDRPCPEHVAACERAEVALREVRERDLSHFADFSKHFWHLEALSRAPRLMSRGDPEALAERFTLDLTPPELEEWVAWGGAPPLESYQEPVPPFESEPEPSFLGGLATRLRLRAPRAKTPTTLWELWESVPPESQTRAALAAARLVLPHWERAHPTERSHAECLAEAEARCAAGQEPAEDVPLPIRFPDPRDYAPPALVARVAPRCASAAVHAAITTLNGIHRYRLYSGPGEPSRMPVLAASLLEGVERTWAAVQATLDAPA